MLAIVLFTDIVGSTDRARELGDGRWRDLLERHNEIVRRDPERREEIDTAGDGFFATFDGPARAIRCARSIVQNARRRPRRALGSHTGECELSADSVRHRGPQVRAPPLPPGEVLVSST
jgi:class 3 adenylate cyclase